MKPWKHVQMHVPVCVPVANLHACNLVPNIMVVCVVHMCVCVLYVDVYYYLHIFAHVYAKEGRCFSVLYFYLHNYLGLAASVNLFQTVPQVYFHPTPGAIFTKHLRARNQT